MRMRKAVISSGSALSLLAGGSLVVYALAFVLLRPVLGHPAASLAVIPVFLVAWVCSPKIGTSGGALVGLMSLPFNALLAHFFLDADVRDFVVTGPTVSRIVVATVVGGAAGYAGSLNEQVRELAKEMERRALHDPLTDLPNRVFFNERLAQTLSGMGRTAGIVAVLFLDLNDFKRINDSLGHAVGDQLLTMVAKRLRGCLRPTDTLARFSGDEFVVLLEDMETPQSVVHVAARLTEEFVRPFVVMGHEVVTSTSIGISLSETGRERPEEILRSADTAMYQVKASGLSKAGYRVFDPGMHLRAIERLRTENELRRAIDRGELRVWYQPKVDLRSGATVRVEALVRWKHPQRGLLMPSEFVAVAEQTGLIVPMGEWVLGQACAQLKEWQEEHPKQIGALGVEVNLSAVQLQYPKPLLEAVEGAVKRSGQDGQWLSLDLTETAWLDAATEKSDCLQALKGMKVGIAIDDFGTGYSSLAYLKRLPANTLKIDQSFISGICESATDAALVGTIVDLAHTLGMRVVGEGVESAEQAWRLREMGCDIGQGYYFCEPLPPDEISGLLVNHLPL